MHSYNFNQRLSTKKIAVKIFIWYRNIPLRSKIPGTIKINQFSFFCHTPLCRDAPCIMEVRNEKA